MSEGGVVHQLPVDDENDNTEKDPRHKDVGIVSLFQFDVTNGQHIQLLVVVRVSGIDREENGPGDEATNQANESKLKQKPKEKIAIGPCLLDKILLRPFQQVGHPRKQAAGALCRFQVLGNRFKRVTRLINTSLLLSEKNKAQNEHGENDQVGNK